MSASVGVVPFILPIFELTVVLSRLTDRARRGILRSARSEIRRRLIRDVNRNGLDFRGDCFRLNLGFLGNRLEHVALDSAEFGGSHRLRNSAGVSHRSRHLVSSFRPSDSRKLLDAGELIPHSVGSSLDRSLRRQVQDAPAWHVHTLRSQHRRRSRQPFAQRLKERFAVVNLLTGSSLSRQFAASGSPHLNARRANRTAGEVELVGRCFGSRLSRLTECWGGHGLTDRSRAGQVHTFTRQCSASGLLGSTRRGSGQTTRTLEAESLDRTDGRATGQTDALSLIHDVGVRFEVGSDLLLGHGGRCAIRAFSEQVVEGVADFDGCVGSATCGDGTDDAADRATRSAEGRPRQTARDGHRGRDGDVGKGLHGRAQRSDGTAKCCERKVNRFPQRREEALGVLHLLGLLRDVLHERHVLWRLRGGETGLRLLHLAQTSGHTGNVSCQDAE